MSDEQARKLLKWVPIAIAAGYFVFLIATWFKYVQSQAKMHELFELRLGEWHNEWLAKQGNAASEPES